MTTQGAHDAIKNSASLLLCMTAKMYGNPQLLQQIKADHKAYRGY